MQTAAPPIPVLAAAKFDAAPILIGVTGHREIPSDAFAPLRDRFGEILDRLTARYSYTPLVLLSALAEGADTIAAQEALARDIPVLACLPLPPDEYEKDFTGEGAAQFRDLLSRCTRVSVVARSENRERAYAEAGAYIAYYSALLVAFWDGDPSRGHGGTADIVQLRQQGLGLPTRLERVITYVPDIGPVFQIITPRRGEPAPAHAFALHEIYPKRPALEIDVPHGRERKPSMDPARAEFEQALTNLNRYNADLLRQRAPHATDTLASFQIRTDSAANRLQRSANRSLRWMYIVAAIAGSAQLIIQPPVDNLFNVLTPATALILRLGLVLAALVYFLVAKRKDYENRYQDYRALAEGLRVQRAWCFAGLRSRFAEASYLQMQQSELQWIRLALRTISLLGDACTPKSGDSPDNKECRGWLHGQLEYYKHSAVREERKKHNAHVTMTVLVAIGAGLSIGAAFSKFVMQNHDPMIDYTIAVAAPFFGGIALLLRFYAQQRGFSENARRYQHMYVVFEEARRDLQNRSEDAAQIIGELGHEALSEQADWLILHRERPLDFVAS